MVVSDKTDGADINVSEWHSFLEARTRGLPLTLPSHGRRGQLGDAFRPLIEARAAGARFALGQLGQSIDGRIATASGQSHYIINSAALLHLHRLRALVDAVIVGVGTVLADDPQLTVRRCPGPQPARVVIDPHGRITTARRCFAEDGVERIVIQERHCSRPPGVEIVTLPGGPAGLAPQTILDALAERGLNIVLVEGGATTISRMLAADCLDRLHVAVAPLIIGSGQPGLMLPEIASLAEARRPATTCHPLPGGDLLLDCDLRRDMARS
jgi:riboflavin-specific deaminase-like protein